MAAFKYILVALLLAGVCQAAWKPKMKRSAKPVDQPKDEKKPSWLPVSEPQEFTVMVDDNINKADQFRHETWKPGGVIEGEYAAPSRDGKWLKVNYRADKDGFHVLSQQVVNEGELNQPTGGSAADHQAKIETSLNGKDTKYTVKEEDLKKAGKDTKGKLQQDHTALWSLDGTHLIMDTHNNMDTCECDSEHEELYPVIKRNNF